MKYDKCPQCGSTEFKPHLVIESIEAWIHHRRHYGSGVPPFYYIGNEWDYIIYLSCLFLDTYNKTQPLSDDEFIEKFIESIKPEEAVEKGFVNIREHLEPLLVLYKKINKLGTNSKSTAES